MNEPWRLHAPTACTLDGGSYQERMAWIAALNRDALIEEHRNGPRLELTYAGEVLARARELVAREQQCCGFLDFELKQHGDTIRLIITAPKDVHDALDAVFKPFLVR